VAGARGSKKEAIWVNHRSCVGARSSRTRPLPRSCQDIRVVRGSLDAIASSAPAGNENVASTTTIGRVPPASSPILASTERAASGLPSTAIVSGAIA
jgi:hypothetical protein